MEKVHFTVFSQAYYVDSEWGFGCPSGGIRNFGNLCHKYNIPVTWLVSPKSARCEQEMFTKFHKEHGDEIAIMFRFEIEEFNDGKERQLSRTLSVNDYRKMIRNQKAEVEKYLPWANVKTAGQGIRDERLLEALELEGFTGMFGHCYCQIGTDSITDFGMPWGSFQMRKNDAFRPALPEEKNGLVAFEWTMRDLNRSMHTTFPEIWSTDPNDVERGGVCTDTNVEYWKSLYLEYEKALPLNDKGIWFQFHQEAHEQTWGEICKPFTKERVVFCTKMMNLFFEWLVKRDSVEFLTASQAAELYKKKQDSGTIPMYIPYSWIPVPEELDFWRQIKDKVDYAGEIHRNNRLFDDKLKKYLTDVNDADPTTAMKNPPWMDSFFFFDHECQLVFDVGDSHPFVLFNYLNFEPTQKQIEDAKAERGGSVAGSLLESDIPKTDISISSERIEIIVENTKHKIIPYGVFLWKNQYPEILDKFKLINNLPNGVASKISQNQGVFLRFNLTPGTNKLVIK